MERQTKIGTFINPQSFIPRDLYITHTTNVEVNPADYNINQVTAQMIEEAFFKPAESCNSIKITITPEIFKYIQTKYLNALEALPTQSHIPTITITTHKNYIQNLQYTHNGNVEVIVYPAYSKILNKNGHNCSGDTAIEIHLQNGKAWKFVFDAPSKIDKQIHPYFFSCFCDSSINNINREDTMLTMHTKIIYLLTKCSNTEYLNKIDSKSPTNNISAPSRFRLQKQECKNIINFIIELPYVEFYKSMDSTGISINGDCNALVFYNQQFVPLSAGILKKVTNNHTNALNTFYTEKNWTVSTAESMNKIIEINNEYANYPKNFVLPHGGFNNNNVLCIKDELKDLPIILVSDGITDNLEFFAEHLQEYIENPNNINLTRFMTTTKTHMQKLNDQCKQIQRSMDQLQNQLIQLNESLRLASKQPCPYIKLNERSDYFTPILEEQANSSELNGESSTDKNFKEFINTIKIHIQNLDVQCKELFPKTISDKITNILNNFTKQLNEYLEISIDENLKEFIFTIKPHIQNLDAQCKELFPKIISDKITNILNPFMEHLDSDIEHLDIGLDGGLYLTTDNQYFVVMDGIITKLELKNEQITPKNLKNTSHDYFKNFFTNYPSKKPSAETQEILQEIDKCNNELEKAQKFSFKPDDVAFILHIPDVNVNQLNIQDHTIK